MKQFIVTYVCRETLENQVELLTEIAVNKKFLKTDIPKRVNSSKTITNYDSFAGWLYITTITRIA